MEGVQLVNAPNISLLSNILANTSPLARKMVPPAKEYDPSYYAQILFFWPSKAQFARKIDTTNLGVNNTLIT